MPDENPFAGSDSFSDQTYTEIALDAADLTGKEFHRCTFRRCKLPGSVWREAKLEDCRFENCDLTRAAPAGLGLRGVSFTGCKLMGIDFTDVGKLPDVSFHECDLRYASFVKLRLRATRFLGCTAREANFLDMDLTEADFTNTDLSGSTIAGCVLAKTDFRAATGVFFDPQKNRVKGVRISVETALLLVQALGIVVEG